MRWVPPSAEIGESISANAQETKESSWLGVDLACPPKVDAQTGTEPPIVKAPPGKGKHPPGKNIMGKPPLVVAQDARSMWCCF